MSIFSPTDGPCGIFSPEFCGMGTQQVVTFLRSVALVQHRAPTQTAAGEVLLSFVEIGTFLLDTQPAPAGYSRMAQGILVKVDMFMYGVGFVPVQEGDRCTLSAVRLEVTNALHWGQEHTEIELQHLGR